MKLEDAYVAWTPVHWTETPTAGHIYVGYKSDVVRKTDHGSGRLTMWNGVCSGDFGTQLSTNSKTAEWQRIALMMLTFNTLVVRDGLSPEAVHHAFLAIDEYRWKISRDTPGATDSDEFD